MSTPTVIKRNDRHYVTDLLWQTLSDPQRRRQQTQELGDELGLDRVASLRYPALQAGYADRDKLPSQWRNSNNLYALAGHIAQSEPGSWLGVFDLGDGDYYIFAISKDVIHPDTDFVGGKSEIQEVFDQLVSERKETWSGVYAPGEFGNYPSRSLDDVLDESEDPPTLKPVYFELTNSIAKQAGVIGGLAAVLALVLYAFFPTITYNYVIEQAPSDGDSVIVQDTHPPAADRSGEDTDRSGQSGSPGQVTDGKTGSTPDKQDADKSSSAPEEEPGPEQPEPSPETPEKQPTLPPASDLNWRSAQEPIELLANCEKHFNNTSLYGGGWSLTQWICGPLKLSVSYQGASNTDAPPTITSDQVVKKQGQIIQVGVDVGAPRSDPIEGASSEQARQTLSKLQGLPWTVQTRPQRIQGAPNLRGKRVRWEQTLDPFQLQETMTDMPGLYLWSIRRSGEPDGRWAVKGVIYTDRRSSSNGRR